MRDEIKRQVDVCLDELRRNALREDSLRRIAELADGLPGGRQDLLYLQAEQTSVTSRVIGMGMFVDGEFSDGPEDADDWPYQTVGRGDGRRMADRQVPGDGDPARRPAHLRTGLRVHPGEVEAVHMRRLAT